MQSFRERLTNILKDITYKPGWKFEVLPDEPWKRPRGYGDTVVLRGTMMVPSLDLEGHPLIPVHFHKNFTDYCCGSTTDGDIIMYIMSGLIREMEMHEMDEWLKFRGFNVRDPHPEQKRHVASVEDYLQRITG